ncbi:MAG: hypothetical protein LM591_05560 [Candidatus Korarchaeum sp.]|jgi:hypothetical protein|nr:hypothetical protein [Candidatus Korarchaeum sp.]
MLIRAHALYYAIAGASLGDLIWILNSMKLPILEIYILIALALSILVFRYDLEEIPIYLLSFILPLLSVQLLLSLWYLRGIEDVLEFRFLSSYLLTTSVLSSLFILVSSLLFSLLLKILSELVRISH